MITFRQFLILEAKEDDIASKNHDRIIQRYQQDLQQHPGVPKFSEPLEVIKYLSSSISPKLIIWIANQYLRGSFSLEDVGTIKVDLTDFNKLKPILPKKDIGQYSSLSELRQTIEQYQDQMGKKQTTVNKENELKKWVDKGEAEIVFNKGGILIVHPKTYKANCALGSGTKWCTTSEGSSSYFDDYNEDGPLYIIFTPDKQKYQYHAESNQFMDKMDLPEITIFKGSKSIVIKYPAVYEFLKTLPNSEWLIKQVENIKTALPRVGAIQQNHGHMIRSDVQLVDKLFDELEEELGEEDDWVSYLAQKLFKSRSSQLTFISDLFKYCYSDEDLYWRLASFTFATISEWKELIETHPEVKPYLAKIIQKAPDFFHPKNFKLAGLPVSPEAADEEHINRSYNSWGYAKDYIDTDV